jgi:hypothetical protein
MYATSPSAAIGAPVPLLVVNANGSSIALATHRQSSVVFAHKVPVHSHLLGYG